MWYWVLLILLSTTTTETDSVSNAPSRITFENFDPTKGGEQGGQVKEAQHALPSQSLEQHKDMPFWQTLFLTVS